MNEQAQAAATPGLERGATAGIAYLRRKGARANPPLVLLLHVIGSNAASWLPFMNALDFRLPLETARFIERMPSRRSA